MFDSEEFSKLGVSLGVKYAPVTKLTAVIAPNIGTELKMKWNRLSLIMVMIDFSSIMGCPAYEMNRVARALEGQEVIADYISESELAMSSRDFQIPAFIGNYGYDDADGGKTLGIAIDGFLNESLKDLQAQTAQAYGYFVEFNEKGYTFPMMKKFMAIDEVKATKRICKTSYNMGMKIASKIKFLEHWFTSYAMDDTLHKSLQKPAMDSFILRRMVFVPNPFEYDDEEAVWTYEELAVETARLYDWSEGKERAPKNLVRSDQEIIDFLEDKVLSLRVAKLSNPIGEEHKPEPRTIFKDDDHLNEEEINNIIYEEDDENEDEFEDSVDVVEKGDQKVSGENNAEDTFAQN